MHHLTLNPNQANKIDTIHAIYHTWNIHHCRPPITLDKQFLLYYTPSYFTAAFLAQNRSDIIKDGISYELHYADGFSKKDIVQARRVKLSFRYSKSLDIAVCLIAFSF